MEGYEQNLHINDRAFEKMRADADMVLQRLIKNMIEKDSLEGKVTIAIDVSLTQEFIPNRDPNIGCETRRVLIPKFSHKVGSVMQIKNEAKGDMEYDGMELVWDEERKEYVLKPIANTEQMSIFDAEFNCVSGPERSSDDSNGQDSICGRSFLALPEPIDDADDADGYVEEDMSDEFGEYNGLPFDEEEYGYEPGGEY